ncbi:DUF5133 domain-containing protein [Streptomyces sp. NPDC058534]|uniref:DUF5133 domain-containing protein n=1 Tax=Streptomyces sp. NPDC058534 TaxID=3346541 RepID=UPI0036638AEE
MLMPHPAVLRALVERYEAAKVSEPPDPSGGPGPATRDLEYTLCVSMGTRDVRQALETARRLLATGAASAAPAAGPGPVAEPAGVAD